jgi:hypothetical protein
VNADLIASGLSPLKPNEFSRAVAGSPVAPAGRARKVARMYGTPVYVMKDGKIVAEQP